MQSPFFLVGPTGVGKSALAIEAARLVGAEIVGADAYQVYGGLATLTAQPSKDERRTVPHHLVGHVPPDEEYSVARYLEEARACLDDVAARGRPALVVGGSGLYVRALTHGLSPLPPADAALRAELESWDCAHLLERLHSLDPAAPAMIDAQNSRRVIRAIEICTLTGQTLRVARSTWEQAEASTARGIFLMRERTDLHARIERRLRALPGAGALSEVAALPRAAMSATSCQTIGYHDLRLHLEGGCTLEASLEAITHATRRYSKRQMTWFRGKTTFETVNLSATDDKAVLDRIADHFG